MQLQCAASMANGFLFHKVLSEIPRCGSPRIRRHAREIRCAFLREWADRLRCSVLCPPLKRALAWQAHRARDTRLDVQRRQCGSTHQCTDYFAMAREGLFFARMVRSTHSGKRVFRAAADPRSSYCVRVLHASRWLARRQVWAAAESSLGGQSGPDHVG